MCRKTAEGCEKSGEEEIIGLAPMIDHEFSIYYQFPDYHVHHKNAFDEPLRSISGADVTIEEYAFVTNTKERKLMKASAVALHHNLVYIKEHYPEVTQLFLDKLSDFEYDLLNHREWFELQKNSEYPDEASSFAFYIGIARYKEKDEQKAVEYEKQYAGKEKIIDFSMVNRQVIYEIKLVMGQLKNILQ